MMSTCKGCEELREALMRLIKAVDDSASVRMAMGCGSMTNGEARAMEQASKSLGWPVTAAKILRDSRRAK